MEKFLADVWELAKTAGPFGSILLLYIWLKTDSERREQMEQKDKLIERVLEAMSETKSALKDLAQVFEPRSRK